MKKYVIRRLLLLIPILLGITFLSFALMRIAGSDAVLQQSEVSGVALSPEVIAARRAELGLDQPFLAQYFRWLGGFLTGDLGTSYISGSSVFTTFVSKLPATLLLTLLSMGLTVVISLPLGILAAVRQNRFTDYLIRVCSFIGNSLPNFFVALVLMYLLAIYFPVFPVISEEVSLRSAALPALTLAIAMSAKIYAADPGGGAGGAGQRLRDRSPGQGSGFFCDPAEICLTFLSVLHPHPDGAVFGKSAGRDSHRGVYFYVGRSGKTGGGRHQYAGLSCDPGLCGVDGRDLCSGKSHYGSLLPGPGSPGAAGR